MRKTLLNVILLLLIAFIAFSCDKDNGNKPPNNPDIAMALTNYWEDQADMTAALETRAGTMDLIVEKIENLGNRRGRNEIAEINALVENYVNQSNAAGETFEQMILLENNIVPYGDVGNKGLFTSVCKGIYNKAKDTVVSGGRMVRSGWRVLSGSHSLRQVLRDPESGIPVVSHFAEKVARHNSERDACIRQSIMENNDQEGYIPLDRLQGNTPQEKVNYYLNLDEEDPLKMSIRRDVMWWDEEQRIRTAETARDLGETGVRIVADAYGGNVGEITNEILYQHLSPDQDPNDKGTVKLTVVKESTGQPPIEDEKTIIINKSNAPANDSRITVIENAPQEMDLDLPSGVYDFIVIAEGHIRTFMKGVSVARDELQTQVARLLDLMDNAIIVESITATPEVVNQGGTAQVTLVCASTIGQNLSFEWSVTGGAYANFRPNKNNLTFRPTEEGIYTVSVTVTDGLNNSRTATTEISCLHSRLVFQGYSIYQEEFNDDLFNPGEIAALELEFKNEGTEDLEGIVRIQGLEGTGVGFYATNASVGAGESVFWLANVQVPTPYTSSTAKLKVLFDTEDENNNPVTISNIVEIPVDFYVEINPITSPVTDRVLTIRGKVANPSLTSAVMILDGDPEQAFQLNLNNGSFSQKIAITGSSEPVNHSVIVNATSGPVTASASAEFTSHVPPTALRITLTWDTADTDVDLWCTDPNGEKCYYANRTTASGLHLDFDDTNGYGPENITTTTIIPGDYLVQVHYYSDHDYYNAIATSPVVVIRMNEGAANETSNSYYGHLNDSGDLWTVTTLHFDGKSWRYKDSDTHSVKASNTLPAKH